ncbi:MAG: 3-oxoacyl-ACP synthase [Flavobacteriaceae bacterium TMED265]|nr:MAG: 3-oxoacyl-ACP synthase [Flavobacteriaceae bacterium TMED265]
MAIGILGTGSYIPNVVTKNEHFLEHDFYSNQGDRFEVDNTEIIEKFQAITGIRERRYAQDDELTSDLGYQAAKNAIEDAAIDKESIDYIIFAHNFGDVRKGENQSDLIPSLASKVKNQLQIKNPNCVAYDMIFGCPGWIEAMIQAKAFIQSGMAKNCLIIGGESLSRVVDHHDRDSMIFADGAGACILGDTQGGGEILAHHSQTFAGDETFYLYFDKSNHKENGYDNTRFIKMNGRKVYEIAVINVPEALRVCLEKSGESIENVKKVFIHQANEKMDEAIIKRFYRKFKKEVPKNIMPMNIQTVGNNSVATVPILYDMVRQGVYSEHELREGEIVIMASVGAGMNINAVVYKY